MILDILFPYYGRVDHMKLAVRSVLEQSDPQWRLLVFDDGYPDDSIPAWFESLDDERVVYRRNSQNLGAQGNYRQALEHVESPWWVMMGADDVMLPNYVARVKKMAAEHPDAGYLHPGVSTIDQDGRPTAGLVEKAKAYYRPNGAGTRELEGEEIALTLARGDWMYFPAICWNTEATKSIGFRPGLNVVQDLALAYDVILSGRSVVVDDEVVFDYRRHAGSDSSVRALTGTRFIEEARFFNEMAQAFDQRGWRRASRASRRRLSSRVNAGLLIPRAIAAGNRDGVRNLTRHVFGR